MVCVLNLFKYFRYKINENNNIYLLIKIKYGFSGSCVIDNDN